MNYAIGDTVVHWIHGLGTVIGIDQMAIQQAERRELVATVVEIPNI